MSQQVIAINLQVLELKYDNSSQIKRYYVETTIGYPLNDEKTYVTENGRTSCRRSQLNI